jgi:hypothetical protein
MADKAAVQAVREREFYFLNPIGGWFYGAITGIQKAGADSVR